MSADEVTSGHADLIKAQKKLYHDRFQQHGDSPQGVFWNNLETQQLRFARLLQHLPDPGSTDTSVEIHEIGCATGALGTWLKQRSIPWKYSGSDLVESSVDVCRSKFPAGNFYIRDILNDTRNETYDFVLASGVFNYRDQTPADEWQSFVEQMLRRMFAMSDQGIAFNFLTSDITIPPDPTLHYIDPREMAQFCHQQLSRFIVVDTCYPLFEVTVSVFTEDYARRLYSDDLYARYFSSRPKN